MSKIIKNMICPFSVGRDFQPSHRRAFPASLRQGSADISMISSINKEARCPHRAFCLTWFSNSNRGNIVEQYDIKEMKEGVKTILVDDPVYRLLYTDVIKDSLSIHAMSS